MEQSTQVRCTHTLSLSGIIHTVLRQDFTTLKVGTAGWDRDTTVPVAGPFSGFVTKDRSGKWSGMVLGTVTSTSTTTASRGTINLYVTADLQEIKVLHVNGQVTVRAELDPKTEKITDSSYYDIEVFGPVEGSGTEDGPIDVSGMCTGTVVIRACNSTPIGCRAYVDVS
jgi:hypothetical protein